jgi:hypothetical protein
MSPIYVPGKVVLAQTYTEGDRNFSNVSLLLHGNGANGSTTIVDSSPTPKTVTAVGNAQISTAQSKFGGASIAFDGTGDYLTVPNNADLNVGTGDFTVELWLYRISALLNTDALLSKGGSNIFIGIDASTSKIVVSHYAVAVVFTSSAAISNGTWYHFALCRSGTAIKMYINGAEQAATTSSANFTSTSVLAIGADILDTNGQRFNGYIDDLRITKGVARYTANFTPPVAPFADAQY